MSLYTRTNIIPFKMPPTAPNARVSSRQLTTICSTIRRVSELSAISEEDVEELLSEATGINGINGLQVRDFDTVLRFLIGMVASQTTMIH